MKYPEAATLRRRWTAETLAALQTQVVEQSRIVKGPHRFESDWADTDEGRTDLRGLAVGREGIQFRFLSLSQVDFQHAKGRLSFFECELVDCRFDAVSLSAQPHFDRGFERCSFRDASVRGLALGRHLVDCDFTGADARKLRSLPNTRFERCVFDSVDLSGAEFADTTFVDCSFVDAEFSATSSLTRCTLIGTTIVPGPARLTGVTIDGQVVSDQWTGETEASAAFDSYAKRYAAASDADDWPLEPDS